jgi:hypothetical protein
MSSKALTQRLGAFLEQALANGLPLDDSTLENSIQVILSDDPLLLHLHDALKEYHVKDALVGLLNGTHRFNRQNEELAILELLGLAREQDGYWVVRNSLLRKALETWISPSDSILSNS